MRAPPEILILGAGGHARVLVDLLRSIKRFRIKGLLDREVGKTAEAVLGVPIVGSWDDLEDWKKKGLRHVALAAGDNKTRKRLAAKATSLGFQIPTLIHRDAQVEPSAQLEAGAVICLGALIGAGAVIQTGVLVNTGSIIDHETVLQPYVHVAPGCAVAGRASVGTGSFIGIGSCVIDHVTIGAWSVIGAGSVVVSNIPGGVTALGVPARVQGPRA